MPVPTYVSLDCRTVEGRHPSVCNQLYRRPLLKQMSSYLNIWVTSWNRKYLHKP